MKIAKVYSIFFCFLFLIVNSIYSQNNTTDKKEILISDQFKWSERMALSIMKRHPKAWQIDNHEAPKWDYKIGMILTGFEKLYAKNKDRKYYTYIKEYADSLIDDNGLIQNFNPQDHNIDFINAGKILFVLNDNENSSKYLKAIMSLRKQFIDYPRTASGGFWHKKIYPNQMWLDGLYMGEPFYARYTSIFENGDKLNDVAHQFELLHDHSLDAKTGLYFHAWDESKQMAWADKISGTAPHVWLRALGWYAMALVDVLDYFPKDHPKHKVLKAYLNELITSVVKYQDHSGLWFQVPDLATNEGNYLEASGSSMLIYSIAKGVNKGYLPLNFKKNATLGFDGLINKLIKVDSNGEIHITQVCASAGLGGNPYRDGSFNYYISEKIKVDNSHGLGAFLLAAIELDK